MDIITSSSILILAISLVMMFNKFLVVSKENEIMKSEVYSLTKLLTTKDLRIKEQEIFLQVYEEEEKKRMKLLEENGKKEKENTRAIRVIRKT